MNNDIRLGLALAEIKNSYYFTDVAAFISGESDNGGMYFVELKPYFDKYGYTTVINLINQLYKEYKQERDKNNGTNSESTTDSTRGFIKPPRNTGR